MSINDVPQIRKIFASFERVLNILGRTARSNGTFNGEVPGHRDRLSRKNILSLDLRSSRRAGQPSPSMASGIIGPGGEAADHEPIRGPSTHSTTSRLRCDLVPAVQR